MKRKLLLVGAAGFGRVALEHVVEQFDCAFADDGWATGAVVDGVFFHNGEDGLPVSEYVDENVSAKVVKIIQSYTGVVNKMVWRKE